MTNKKKKRQEEFLKKLRYKYRDHDDLDNFYPTSMTDSDFIKIITEYFLGEKFYIADPLPPGQANVIIAYEIISNN